MNIYIALFVFVIFFSFLLDVKLISSNYRRGIFVLIFLSLTLVSGLRGSAVGVDTKAYNDIFYLLQENVGFYSLQYEPGFVLLNILVGFLSNNSQFVIFFSSLLFSFFILKAAAYKNKALSVYLSLFLGLSFYFFSFNGVRQAIAASIFIFGLRYIAKKEFRNYLLTCIAAAMFHFTALLMIPFYFLSKIKYNRVFLVGLWSFSLIFLLFPAASLAFLSYVENIIPSMYMGYLDIIPNEGESVISSRDFLYQFFYVVILYFYSISKKSQLGLVIANFTLMAVIITNFLFHLGAISRLSVYFEFVIPLYFSWLATKINPLSIKLYFIILLILLSFILFFRAVLINSNGVFPYQMFSL